MKQEKIKGTYGISRAELDRGRKLLENYPGVSDIFSVKEVKSENGMEKSKSCV